MVGTLQRSIPGDQPSCVIERPACGSQIASLQFLDTTRSQLRAPPLVTTPLLPLRAPHPQRQGRTQMSVDPIHFAWIDVHQQPGVFVDFRAQTPPHLAPYSCRRVRGHFSEQGRATEGASEVRSELWTRNSVGTRPRRCRASIWHRRSAAVRERLIQAVRRFRDRRRSALLRARMGPRPVPSFVKPFLIADTRGCAGPASDCQPCVRWRPDSI
jgi:hypothetical protein